MAYTNRKQKDIQLYDVAVVGAGASGCMAAIAAAESGASVLLVDKNDKIGRKIYATGNGRCNITNLSMSADKYHAVSSDLPGARSLEERVSSILSQFDAHDMVDFWESQGVYLHNRNGYVYPRTDQAETIVRFWEKQLSDLHVNLRLSEEVRTIVRQGHLFILTCDKEVSYKARRVILAGGGLAGPQYGCGSGIYRLAAGFGHTVTSLYPALVPLSGDAGVLKYAAGVRCDASIAIAAVKQGQEVIAGTERGELQLLKDSLSGIPVFQLSKYVGKLLDEKYAVKAVIDFLPEFAGDKWEAEIERRLQADRNCMLGDYFMGLVNRKVLDMVLANRRLQAEKKASKLSDQDLCTLLEDLRAFEIAVTGIGTFKQAQVTAGGVPLSEMSGQLESNLVDGLYFAGELIDVDGICGGYNLQFACAAGCIAGRAAGRKDMHA